MRSIATEAYEATKIGATGLIQPDRAKGESLESFQAVVLDAKRMSAEGLIHLTSMHHESQTGNKYIDRIQFIRVK